MATSYDKVAASAWPVIVLLTAIAGVVLYRGAYNASDFMPPPDAGEYALGAHRFAYEGSYTIEVQGQRLPPRYPPWFSILLLAPTYLILGPEPGNSIFAVTALGIGGVVIAFFLGRRVGGESGGILAALAVLSLPAYHISGRQVATDIPCAVLLLAICLLYVHLRVAAERAARLFLLAGALIGVAVLLRPVALAAALPFVLLVCLAYPTRKRLALAGCLLGPLWVAATTTLTYNALTFGSFARTGYHFWCSVPHDYLWLTFSPSYVPYNLQMIWISKLPVLLGVLLLVAGIDWRLHKRLALVGALRRREIGALVEFLLLATGPIVVFHLFFFGVDPRYYLLPLSISAVLIGSVVGSWLPAIPRVALLAVLIATGLILWDRRLIKPDPPPYRRIAADKIKQSTPDDAIIIAAIDPVYLGYMAGKNSHRRIIPISRNVEYASKLVVRHKVPDPKPPPRNALDHRCAGLLNGGAAEAVPFVAVENFDWFCDELAKGNRIFVETTGMAVDDIQPLIQCQRFHFVQQADYLFELGLNSNTK